MNLLAKIKVKFLSEDYKQYEECKQLLRERLRLREPRFPHEVALRTSPDDGSLLQFILLTLDSGQLITRYSQQSSNYKKRTSSDPQEFKSYHRILHPRRFYSHSLYILSLS